MVGVTFVVPVYNKAKYLKYVLKSIEKQKGEFEREYIFINDGSTDDSYEILKQNTKKWRNCRIFSQKNFGSANATNRGIFEASKEFIKFLDADDVLVETATYSLLKLLRKSNQTVLAYGLQKKIKKISQAQLDSFIDLSKIKIINNPVNLAIRNSMFNPSQFLVKTETCKKVGGCDERIKHSQEYSLTLKLSLEGSFIKLLQNVTILPVRAPGQISENKVQQIYRVSRALELFLKDNSNLDKNIRKIAFRRLTGRAWRFAKRHYGDTIYSRWFGLYLKGLFGYTKNLISDCEEANSVYLRNIN
tara:strand:+ start:7111 stop:8019 length:909 start_codon:yes stop_codon:yes gene_type:complete